MADRTIKPDDTNDLVLSNNHGDSKIEVNEDDTIVVSSGGDVTVDATGDIVLDAGGADVTLKDGGTTFGILKQVSGDLVIQPTSSKQIILNEDGGASALTIDTDGNTEITQNIEQADAKNIQTDEVRARDGDGLKLYDDSANGIFVEDGGNVGIGQTSPSSEYGSVVFLHIGSSSANTAGLIIEDNENQWEINNNGNLNFGTGGSTKARIHTSTFDFYTNDGYVYNLSSDIRTKKNIIDIEEGLDIMNQLRPVSFEHNGRDEFHIDNGRVYKGFIADEVKEIIPFYVQEGKGIIDGVEVDDFKTLSTTRMIPMMIKAIQELSAKVTTLENA
jgi:hypothetical protein